MEVVRTPHPVLKSHTRVELWSVRLLGAGYVTIGGYAVGFIGTSVATHFRADVPAPELTGIAVGGLLLLSVLIGYYSWFIR